MLDAETIVRRVIEEAWTGGELSVIDELVAPAYVRRVPGGTVTGVAGFRQRIAAMRAGFPGFATQVDEIFADGERGVVCWTATSTGRKPLSGMTWFRVASGKLVEEWELFDRQELREQAQR